ncbi:MAG: hypothetical protein ACR2M1_11255 [Gemmatimonadaceae bacterium]
MPHRLYVRPAVETMVAYFRSKASADDVQTAVTAACRAMNSAGFPPERIIPALKWLLREAVAESGVSASDVRIQRVSEQLIPWMIVACFGDSSARKTPRVLGSY